MKAQLSQDYNVDGRYSGGKGSIDDNAGKAFVASYIRRGKSASRDNLVTERKEDDRFIVSGPGDTTYSFKNAFRVSK